MKKNNKKKYPSFWELFIDWLKSHSPICQTIDYIYNFWYIWGGLLALLFIAIIVSLFDCEWESSTRYIGVILAFITILILLRPMNAVYGLMGTSGSIRLFFFNFLLITFLFAKIYYWGFFQNAGISYDVNQPHIDYNLYAKEKKEVKMVPQNDTLVLKRYICNKWTTETIVQETKLNYQPIGFSFIWRNTILTTLMQEPTDFFSAASTYNTSIGDPRLSQNKQLKEIELDKQKAKMFQWILIFQVLISWIFFGVFISLLYSKFRYES